MRETIYLLMSCEDEIIGVYHTRENAEKEMRTELNDYVVATSFDD